MKAAIVFGPDAAVDVRSNIQVGNFLVLAVQLDGNAHTGAKSRGVVTSYDFFIGDDKEGIRHAGYFLVAIEFGEDDLHLMGWKAWPFPRSLAYLAIFLRESLH